MSSEIVQPPSSALFVLKERTENDVVQGLIQGRQKEPFYIFNMDKVYEMVQKFREKLPRVQIFYALKSNDYSMMAKIAIALGLGFDCASPGEIYKIRKYNVCPTSIIYAMTTKTPEQMMYARDSGVRHTTFDSSSELKKLKQYWPDVRLLIRIKVESDSVYKLGDKFGCDLDDAFKLLDEAAQLNLRVIGVAFHVGSACFSKDSYRTGLKRARTLFDYEIKEGREMSILDIGGGFIADNMFEEVTDIINEGLETLFPESHIQVIAEPGRFLCESAFTFYNNINDVQTIKTEKGISNMIHTNMGTNGTLRFVESWHTSYIYNKTNINKELIDTTIYGPTLDNCDRLEHCKLANCSLNDWIVYNDQGAYSLSFFSKFCGSKRPQIRCIVTLELWNKLKLCSVFKSTNYVIDPVTTTPLPSTLPPVLPDGDHKHDTLVLEDI